MEIRGLGFGGAPIGNLYAEVSDADARATVDAAWDAGVRYFDTAPHYGLGLSERRLGAALADRPRDEFVLSTKVGRILEPRDGGGLDDAGFLVPATHRRVWDFSADGVRRSLDSSLERLGVDRVDVVYLHDPDDHWEQAVSEGLPALHALKEQGVIGAVGVGMNQWQMPERFIREASLDYVMLAGRYTLLEQESLASFLPLCVERGVSVVAVAVFNSGLLARPEVPVDATYNYAAAPAEVMEKARRIASVGKRHGVVLPQAALQFPFGHPAVTGIAVGARTPAEITENAALLAETVPAELWADLKAEGLLGADVPTPGVAS
ncbi:aldo/keto reductase [Kutzneria buriramensis]|uniref:D-threo-aldose 1-dehydrogenase n=1 Tax=Kutzneria buriramensis TaxID=1045776 RepID=A0A3E0HV71_9PSEU|nr:aldo/keto reductase [Kutzneria buriramensis]REH50328.1 D-threo-aldose 1-dehydrogenase [Kutzneria buriramensis]